MLVPGCRYRPEQVLPHRGRMLLLDEIDDYGADWVRSIVRIRADSLLLGDAGVPAWAGIEYMAQTAAAWSGIEQLQRGVTPGIGFLLGSRRYRSACEHFAAGWELRITAQLLLRDDNDLAIFDCAIQHNEQRLAWADIKAFRPQDVGEFLGR
ncbi:MAG: putative 3-hydroxydecanoyl-[acyl-carrier-protein] dehydratase, inferred for pathway [Hydrocarboniphaga sp.]|nr:putative 3-hydroxydecanoyl-[acyl-carrier-protein] dehydratase, inferred for pathway [Hydrocarboniphaga sp.]